MRNVRVPLFGNVAKSVTVDADATDGATIGVNLRKPDGTLVTLDELGGGSTAPPNDLTTTDDLDEGGYNLYFTNKRAQDAVGGILVDSSSIDFTYDTAAPSITATLKDLPNSGLGGLVGIARDSKGRVSGTRNVTTDDLPEGSANLYFTDERAQSAVRQVFNRIDTIGDIRVDADGNLRITY
jgi:hypothetical protein